MAEIKATLLSDEILNPMSVLGEYRTYYGDSSESRKINIENAVKKVNNTIVKPGEDVVTVSESTG